MIEQAIAVAVQALQQLLSGLKTSDGKTMPIEVNIRLGTQETKQVTTGEEGTSEVDKK